jgi:hypothetical protein
MHIFINAILHYGGESKKVKAIMGSLFQRGKKRKEKEKKKARRNNFVY